MMVIVELLIRMCVDFFGLMFVCSVIRVVCVECVGLVVMVIICSWLMFRC